MRDIVDISGNTLTQLIRNDEDTMLYKQTFYDDNALSKNQQMRHDNLLHRAKLGLHDDAAIRCAISCPSTEQWELFKTQNPTTYENLMSKEEHLRMRAVKEISLLEPAWVIQLRL